MPNTVFDLFGNYEIAEGESPEQKRDEFYKLTVPN